MDGVSLTTSFQRKWQKCHFQLLRVTLQPFVILHQNTIQF